jgi:TFIIF-interacting CTD phosphatase-like protein
MNDYKKVRKCLRQFLNNINNDTPENILDIINKCILYCHNNSLQIKNKKKKIPSNGLSSRSKSLNNSKILNEPFIKEKMKKKFCLVLDLDETLIHNLNLPFGDYFFVRPGLFELFEKIHDIFEIVIFTAGQKNYAYSIIDVIDNNDYIDHILYKKHLIYENGNPIKKLDMIGRDTNKIIFVDNLESNAKYNKKNLYLISSWYDNIYDKELYKLQEKLIKIVNSGRFTDDITKGLMENFM